MATEDEEFDWRVVVARSLAFLCLHYADMGSATKLEKASFLERFGLSRKEAAGLLGTSKASIDELERQQKQGGKKAASSKKTSTGKGGRSGRGRKQG